MRFDSAGVRVVDNPSPDALPLLSASAEPLVSIGAVDGSPEYQLYRVGAARRLSDGSIAVLNRGTNELRFYGADARHRITVGGEGDGPAEFRFPLFMSVESGDTVMVQDQLDRVRYAPDGTFASRVPGDVSVVQALAGPGTMAGGASMWLADGSILAVLYHRPSGPSGPGPMHRPEMTLLLVHPDPSMVDTLGDFGGLLQQYVKVGPSDRDFISVVPPFAPSSVWVRGGEGTLLVTDSDKPEFHLFRTDGTRILVRWSHEPEPITDADVEAWKERQRNASWTHGQLPMLERAWAAMDLPDTRAAYGDYGTVGQDGSIWLPEGELSVDPASYLVFSSDGTLRGRVRLPGPFVTMDAGPGWVLGVYHGPADVEYVRMYAVGGA